MQRATVVSNKCRRKGRMIRDAVIEVETAKPAILSPFQAFLAQLTRTCIFGRLEEQIVNNIRLSVTFE